MFSEQSLHVIKAHYPQLCKTLLSTFIMFMKITYFGGTKEAFNIRQRIQQLNNWNLISYLQLVRGPWVKIYGDNNTHVFTRCSQLFPTPRMGWTHWRVLLGWYTNSTLHQLTDLFLLSTYHQSLEHPPIRSDVSPTFQFLEGSENPSTCCPSHIERF